MNDTIAAGLQRIIFEAVRDALREQSTSTYLRETTVSEKAPEVDLPPIMSSPTLAEFLEVHPKTLERWRLKGIGPKATQPPNTKLWRYMRDDVLEWLGAGRTTEA